MQHYLRALAAYLLAAAVVFGPAGAVAAGASALGLHAFVAGLAGQIVAAALAVFLWPALKTRWFDAREEAAFDAIVASQPSPDEIRRSVAEQIARRQAQVSTKPFWQN